MPGVTPMARVRRHHAMHKRHRAHRL
jgi:hypothetical protein